MLFRRGSGSPTGVRLPAVVASDHLPPGTGFERHISLFVIGS